MKKKVILLIIIIPLVFMLTLFTVGRAVSVVIRVPVSGITILTENEDGVITLDISGQNGSDYDSLPVLEAEVSPVNAANTEWTYTAEGDAVSLVPAANGYYIVPENIGSSRLTVVSMEGGYTDSVTVEVTSSVLWDYIPAIDDAVPGEGEGAYDYTALLTGGTHTFTGSAVPSSFNGADVEWTSSDTDILRIDSVTGIARAVSNGTVAVTASLEGGPTGVIEKRILVTVAIDFPDGAEWAVNGETITAGYTPVADFAAGSRSVTLVFENASGNADISNIISAITQTAPDGTITEMPLNETFAWSTDGKKGTLTFLEGADTSDGYRYTVRLTGGGEFEINFTDFDFGIYTSYHSTDDPTIYQREGTSVRYAAYSGMDAEGVEYEWRLVNAGGVTMAAHGATAVVTVSPMGAATLTVTAMRNGEVIAEKSADISAVENVAAVSIMESYADWGLAGEMALGAYSVSAENAIVPLSYSLDVRYRATEGGYLNTFNGDLLILTTSDSGVIGVAGGNTLNVAGDGEAEIVAKWRYSDYFGANVEARFTIRGVANGVNVSDYNALRTATAIEGYDIVLRGDIMLGKQNATEAELREMAYTMPTSYDWQFYENSGSARPEVYYLIRFTGDVHGNGYTLDGDYFTRATDSVGVPLLFKGPLDFVTVSNGDSDVGVASVKGQDNIVFLASGDITINNVILKGCSDSSLIDPETGEFDLSLLNYAGTTLEIEGNVRLLNSRVSNGRSVVRIYGGGTDQSGDPVVSPAAASSINAAEERYVVSIESCILSRAREFILKIGSNRALRAVENSSGGYTLPYLTDSDGTVYAPDNAVRGKAGFGSVPSGAVAPDYTRGSEFYETFVLTDVTVRNSVLQDSGLFTVGIETHFAGEALTGDLGNIGGFLGGWRDLAATSYASVLRLEGGVRLLDWKNTANIDSSTLIEIAGGENSLLQQFRLNVAEMLETVRGVPGYEALISTLDGADYAHGGIALYGGGLNYCGVDTSGMTTEEFNKYKINLDILAGSGSGGIMVHLSSAAGMHDFVFYMYDAGSETDYYAEQEMILNGTAYILPVAEI